MSNLLRKLLSSAIFPSALIVVTKIVGLALANRVYDLVWMVQTNSATLFSVQLTYPDPNSALLANSFSNLVVLGVLILSVAILLFQSHFLNKDHQNPKVLIKLVQFDFLLWLSESSTIFPRLFTWIAFLWVIGMVVLVQSINGLTSPAISVVGIVSAIVATWLAARDFERELHTILPEHGKLSI